MLSNYLDLRIGNKLVCVVPNKEKGIKQGDTGVIKYVAGDVLYVTINNELQRWILDELDVYLEPTR